MNNLISNKTRNYTTVATDTSALVQGKPTLAVTGNTLKPCKISDAPGADEPITYLIDDFMQEKTFNSIVAPPKCNKSFFATQMAFCVQNGIPLLGYKTHKHHTLIVDFEFKTNVLNKRLQNAKKFYNLPDGEEPDYLAVAEDFENGAVTMEDILSCVTDMICKDPDLKLVIFDCFYKFCKGARNQEGNVKSQLMPLKALTAYGVSVVYITHTNKGNIKEDASVNDIINAAGGSGVHGKIVDTTYVIHPLGKGLRNFIISMGGRCDCFGDIFVTRSPESYNYFTSKNEDVQEVILPNTALCQEIYDYIRMTGYKNEKVIKHKFKVTSDELRFMGFIVDTKSHKITYDESLLALPKATESDEYECYDDEFDEAV